MRHRIFIEGYHYLFNYSLGVISNIEVRPDFFENLLSKGFVSNNRKK